MTQQNPEQIRADIEATRARLGSDVDAVSEKVTPERVVDRQKAKVRGRLQDVRESVMGAADDTAGRGRHLKEGVQDRAGDLREGVQQAPAAARAGTRGNPLAAGLIALGAGWLVGSLLPSTQKEQELVSDAADRVQPHAQHAVESARDVAREVAQDLEEPAREAAESVKETARSGAQEVTSQGRGEAEQLKSSAQDSARTVKDETRNA